MTCKLCNKPSIVAECWTCGRGNRLVAQPLRTPRYLYNNTTVNKHSAAGHDVRPVSQDES